MYTLDDKRYLHFKISQCVGGGHGDLLIAWFTPRPRALTASVVTEVNLHRLLSVVLHGFVRPSLAVTLPQTAQHHVSYMYVVTCSDIHELNFRFLALSIRIFVLKFETTFTRKQ